MMYRRIEKRTLFADLSKAVCWKELLPDDLISNKFWFINLGVNLQHTVGLTIEAMIWSEGSSVVVCIATMSFTISYCSRCIISRMVALSC